MVSLAILGFDFLMPLGVAAAVPSVLLVLLGLWMPWRSACWLLAGAATALTILGYAVSYQSGEPHWVVLTNRLLALAALWITAALCYMQRRGTETLEDDESRLRGLVAGAESPAGAAPGRVEELSAELERYTNLEQRLNALLQSRSWRLVWAAGLPLRKLRARG